MVRRMVDACGGKANVGARPSGGSVVTLILPIPEEAHDERSHAA
jgi:signal transduction histidine kinase